tara:strand:- start:25897 stop:26667 length:771 start_codon:yes stop_codon:yes gene_type:complete
MNSFPQWSPIGKASISGKPWDETTSYQFDGVDDYVLANGAASIIDFNNDPHSVSVWFKMAPTSVALSAMWAFTNSAAANSRYWMSISASGSVVIYGWGNTGGTFPIGSGGGPVTAGSGLDDNAWHNVVVTYNGSNALKAYIDGGSPASFTVAAGALTSNVLSFGARRLSGSTSYAANALLFQSTMYTTEVSAGQVALIYNSGRACNEALLPVKPAHFYRFGDGDSSFPTVIDYGSSPANGTAYNMASSAVVQDAPP